jgi:hypothetical protein
METLRNEPLEQTEGVVQCGIALNKLMTVVKRNFGGRNLVLFSNAAKKLTIPDMSDMQSVKERIAMYRGMANHFARRLSDFLESYFKMQVIPPRNTTRNSL